MANNNSLFSLTVERNALAGLFTNEGLFYDIETTVSEMDFYSEVHQVIYKVIREMLLKGEKLDKVLVANKIKNLGIAFRDNLNIDAYVDNFIKISPAATRESFAELIKLRIKRELVETAEKVKGYVLNSGNSTIDELISNVDSIQNSKILTYANSEDAKDIFENFFDLIDCGEIEEESGLKTPYPEFNRLFGGLKGGNLYAFVARPKNGKTTFLDDLSFGISKLTDFKIKSLLLDTEMDSRDIALRFLSSLTGVSYWYLDTKQYRRYPEMVAKVNAARSKIDNHHLFHYRVANKSIDQVISYIRRWFYTKVGRGNNAVIVYDYIKLTGEKIGQNWAEHQAIGEKIDKIKILSQELNVPIITAMQLNRQGENFNKKSEDIQDDSSAISLSDKISWLATNVSILRRKTYDEMSLDGPNFGTHKLINTAARHQGKDAAGHQDLFKRPMPDGSVKYVQNYINFDITNFKVTEKGSLKDIIAAQSEKFELDDKDPSKTDGDLI